MRILWDERAWEDYLSWQQDKRTLRKINGLIKEIQRTPFEGTGKPEPLTGDMSGWWSRRIDDVNRVVYKQKEDVVIIASCRGHYE